MAEFNYDKSPNMGKQELFTGIGTDQKGNWTYDSASIDGYVEIECPMPHGAPIRRMHAREFPDIAVRYIQESLKPNPYPKSFPMKSATDTVHHFAGAVKGLKLLDDAGIKHMEQMAREFEAKPERQRQEYFDGTLKPFLLGLAPRRRS